jgi:hypothetical protein
LPFFLLESRSNFRLNIVVDCEIYDSIDGFPETPDHAKDGKPEDYITNEWILPDKSDQIGWYDAGYINEFTNLDLYNSVMRGRSKVWLYGIVIYQDSVSKDGHYIRFCFRCQPRENGKHHLFEDGPLAYRREK